MKNSDDILNRYIDGDLNSSESFEFEKMLESSTELRSKLEILKRIDMHLRKVEPESPSALFTSSLMKKLNKKSSFVKSQNYFIIFVTGLFTLFSVGVIAYMVFLVLGSEAESGSTFEISDYLNVIINDMTSIIGNLFNPGYFSYLGSLISIIMIVTGYFFFENHRKLLKKTQN